MITFHFSFHVLSLYLSSFLTTPCPLFHSLTFTGASQGVHFRKMVLKTALAFMLTGRASNEKKGSVIVTLTGDPERVQALISQFSDFMRKCKVLNSMGALIERIDE